MRDAFWPFGQDMGHSWPLRGDAATRDALLLRAIAESPEIERMARYPRPRRLPSRALRTPGTHVTPTLLCLVPSLHLDVHGLPWDCPGMLR